MKKKDELDGQITISDFFQITSNPGYRIVQSNDLMIAGQNLTLLEARIIRLIMMQIMADDMDKIGN